MNTPSHILFGAAVFARQGQPKTTLAAMAGAFVPDISLYVMTGWALYVQGISPNVVFGTYYYSAAWMRVFAFDNSFILWGGLFAFACWGKRTALIAFSGSGLLHLAADFLLHNYDARPQFWPISDWIFQSPVSYWDSRFYARIVAPVELLLNIVFCIILWRRFETRRARWVIGATGMVLAGLVGMYIYALTSGAGHIHLV